MMTRFFGYPAAMAAFLVVAAVSGSPALGYEGVIAPADDGPVAEDDGGDGYSGVIAPSTPKRAPRGSQGDSAEPGYAGVVPGYVPPDEPDMMAVPGKASPVRPQQPGKTYPGTYTPVPSQQPQMTSQYAKIDPKVRTAEDLRTLAMIYSYDKNADGIPDEMAKNFKVPKEMAAFLDQPRARIDGMLPMESMIRDSIDAAMKEVKGRRQKPEETVDNLRKMREGLRAKRSIPDSVYKMMGLPATYVKEEREGIDNSLARIDRAIKQLGG